MEFSRLHDRSGPSSKLLPAIPGLAVTKRSIKVEGTLPGMMESLRNLRTSYGELNFQAAESSKHRRIRSNLGGSADAHYQNELQFWNMREYCRDMVRNDGVVGQLVKRFCDNVLGTGLRLAPNTTDPALDTDLREGFEEWALSRDCDAARKRDFNGLARLGLMHEIVDGDAFVIPRVRPDRGLFLQLYEGERVASPGTFNDDVIHGVSLDYRTDEVKSYYFTNPQPGERKQRRRILPLSLTSPDVTEVRAFDDIGRPNVLHLFEQERASQTRGISAFHAVFDYLSMFEDVNFAKLVQQQVVSCIAVFITKERDYQWGNRSTEGEEDGTTATFEELHPGLTARLKPGEDVKGFSPAVPNAEFFDHVRLILRIIGLSLGMPLELVLLDTSDTTFHGYRGALHQAQKSFTRVQDEFPKKFHRPVYERWLDLELPRLGRVARRKQARGLLYRHDWIGEGWPYVEPKTDAEADAVRQHNALISPRRLQMERGRHWKELYPEIVQDWGDAIELAAKRAEEISKKYERSDVTWRDVLNLDMPSGMSRKGMVSESPEDVKVKEAQATALKSKPATGASK